MANEVAAHYLDGRVVKGISLDLDPGRPRFHIRTAAQGTLEVKLTELKALFFVKDLVGNSGRKDVLALEPSDGRPRGAYPPARPFFFVLPADARSNNLRVLINRAAVKRMSQPPPPAA